MRNLGIIEKIQAELEDTTFDAMLVFGHDNIRYITGAAVPFLGSMPRDTAAVFWEKGGEPVLIVPEHLRDTFRVAGKVRNVQSYGPSTPFKAIEYLVRDLLEKSGLRDGRIGITERRIPAGTFGQLKKRNEESSFVSCDEWIAALRIVKTPAERELLAEAAFKTDHGLSGAAHHVMVYAARPEKGLSEIIRVHCIERGLDMTGYEALAVGASGEHTTVPWPEAPFFGVGKGKQLAEGELVRMEIRTCLDGYWSDAARLLTMGPPSEAQQAAYESLVSLRRRALEILQPGVTCSGAADELLKYCTEKGIELIREHGFGHGIGVSPVEPPFLDPTDPTELREGMVLVLTPTVKGPGGELVRSYDTVIMEENGPRLVGWYKDWDTPYKAVKSYQHGGG